MFKCAEDIYRHCYWCRLFDP